jgi:hypothetical protein
VRELPNERPLVPMPEAGRFQATIFRYEASQANSPDG